MLVSVRSPHRQIMLSTAEGNFPTSWLQHCYFFQDLKKTLQEAILRDSSFDFLLEIKTSLKCTFLIDIRDSMSVPVELF